MPAGPSLADLLRGNHPDYNSDPTYRASMLPVGTYANPDGTESIGFAWPGMIHEPLEAIGRLFGQGNFALGPDAPGNKEDMATLLMSIYGGNALNPVKMAEKAGFSELKNSTFSSKNASLYDPPSKAARPFDADYPNGPHAGENEVLRYDIEGRPLTAKYVVGRRLVGGEDEALSPAQYDAVSEALFGNNVERVKAREIGGDAGRFKVTHDADGNAIYQPLVADSVIAQQAPQRMYHGTSAAEDFSRFQPSAEGSFGPGVYLSESPAVASGRAPAGDGARIFPVDAQGPFASIDDYLTALHANGRDPSAAHRALEQQGYTGVSGDIGSYGAPNPVTNVFAPGSIRSATTGETLFSDTGLPSIWGGAIQDGDSPTLSKILRSPLVTI